MLSRKQTIQKAMRRNMVAGLGAVILLIGGAGGWAAITEVSGAISAPGIVTVEGSSKQVQHPSGGIIAELLIREGQRVDAGQVLIKLDATVSKTNLAVVTKALDQLYARRARLEAERDGREDVSVSAELVDRHGPVNAEALMASERRLFEDRRASRRGQQQRLSEQVAQIDEKIRGYVAQQDAKSDETQLIEKELAGVRILYDRGLAPVDRVNNLARAAARLRGESGLIISAIAEARQKQSEIGIQFLQIDQTLRNDVSTELRDLEGKEGELLEREVAALDQLKHLDLIAPVSGFVNQLSVHTVGGVIRPAEPLMQIVPQQSGLTVEARISPQDIDQVSLGQAATLRLSAFNRSTTPELFGEVIRVSADLVTNEKSGAGFYRVGIKLPESEVARIAPLTLVPGMPVETFIRTGDRTVLSYLSKPIRDHAARVFREQ